MIQAVIFDLDGTLVQSERLKAISYGRAIRERLDLAVPDERIFELYKEVVGQTREVVSGSLVEALGLEERLRSHMAAYDATESRQVLTAMRLQIYGEMVADPQLLRDNQWPHNVELLRIVRATACRTALATSSLTEEARYVLRAISLEDEFEVVVGFDQVERGKPDPEIYLLATSLLAVPPADCLVIEDSPIGVRGRDEPGRRRHALHLRRPPRRRLARPRLGGARAGRPPRDRGEKTRRPRPGSRRRGLAAAALPAAALQPSPPPG